MELVTFKWLKIFITASLLSFAKQDSTITCDMVSEDQNEDGLNHHVRCKGTFQESEILREVLSNITDQIDIFELYNSSLDLLPEDIFRDVKNASVRKVILTESSLKVFSLPESDTSPFHSLGNSLESFEVYHSSFVFAWNFSTLTSLNTLNSVIIENSDVPAIEDAFMFSPNIRFIQIINCKTRWIHKKAFHANRKLSICSLANNLIETVERSMFPRPALYLWSLDLSYNKLKTLPKDMFEDMAYLKELKLDHNRLHVQGDVYKKVWNHLTQLWLDGNDQVCWALCPLIIGNERKERDRPQFFNSSECEKPPKTKILLDSFDC